MQRRQFSGKVCLINYEKKQCLKFSIGGSLQKSDLRISTAGKFIKGIRI